MKRKFEIKNNFDPSIDLIKDKEKIRKPRFGPQEKHKEESEMKIMKEKKYNINIYSLNF